MSALSRREFLIKTGTFVSAATFGLIRCGGAATPGSTATAAGLAAVWVGDEAAMEAAAKREGKLVFYGLAAEQSDVLMTGFKTAYPWVATETISASSSQVISKFITEQQTGANFADVAYTGGPSSFQPLSNASAIAKGLVPNDEKVPQQFRDPAQYLHPFLLTPYLLAYNTNLVSAPPKDVLDLADPIWRGKIAFERPQLALGVGPLLASRRAIYGEAKWRSWLQGIKDNNVFLTPDSGAAHQAVLRGERSICITALKAVFVQATGSPVAMVFHPQMIAVPMVVVLSAKAPHPHVAALFINWLLDPNRGQIAVVKANALPSTGIDSPLGSVIPKDVTYAPLSSMADYFSNPKIYNDIFSEYWPG